MRNQQGQPLIRASNSLLSPCPRCPHVIMTLFRVEYDRRQGVRYHATWDTGYPIASG